MKTKDEILKAALRCARRHGLYAMTRAQIAEAAGIATGTVSFHFGTVAGVREAAVKEIIRRSGATYLDVLAEALGHRDSIAVAAPVELKRLALNTLA